MRAECFIDNVADRLRLRALAVPEINRFGVCSEQFRGIVVRLQKNADAAYLDGELSRLFLTSSVSIQ